MKFALVQETKQKIVKSFLIASAGFIVGLIALLLADPNVMAWLSQHPIVALALSTYLPFLLNGLNEFRKNPDRLSVE